MDYADCNETDFKAYCMTLATKAGRWDGLRETLHNLPRDMIDSMTGRQMFEFIWHLTAEGE